MATVPIEEKLIFQQKIFFIILHYLFYHFTLHRTYDLLVSTNHHSKKKPASHDFDLELKLS